MSALPVDDSRLGDLWTALAHLDHDPEFETWRAELVEGHITLTPPPAPEHERIITAFTKQLVRQDPDDNLTFWLGGTGLRIGADNGVKPDILVSDEDAFADAEGEYNPPDGEPLHLVVEVTSRSTRDVDYQRKMRVYASGRIPYYLIVDRQDRVCRLYRLTDGAESYGPPVAVSSFDEPLALPAPLGFDLDLTRFA